MDAEVQRFAMKPESAMKANIMKTGNRKKGFILMLVVGMIPLVGMVLAILAANSKMLAAQTRREMLRTQAENASQSGLAWITQNRGTLPSLLGEEKAVLLSLEDGVRPITCRIERVGEVTEGNVFYIIGHAEEGTFSAEDKRQVVIPPAN